ncbi:efflux RND transporter permease subunit [Salipaludibacillus sp. HK11]|uniref:efflux RND transporter permease subunit n=1 Tax=Salipaludibacillus sp. HK11 TaxID=3394320 RepID=UPI0039FC60D1
MNALKFIIQRKILIGLMVVLVLCIGSYSMIQLDKELLPSLSFDGAYVEVDAGDMAAIEVERSITTSLETSILAIDGVESVNSTSSIGRSSIQVFLEEGGGDDLYKEVQSVVNSSIPNLNGVTDHLIGQIGTDQDYEFFMDISDGNMNEMSEFGTDVLVPRLEGLREVKEVALGGIQEHEVSIAFQRDEITERNIDVSQVIDTIQHANSEATVGELTEEQDSPTLRWDAKIEGIESIESLKIPTQDGWIDLEDIATVSVSSVQNASNVWKNGSKDFIFVQIGRNPDVTQIDMANAIRSELDDIHEEGLVENFQLNEMVAQADYVQESIDGVSSNIMIGGAIAVVILLLFLQNIRATIIVAVSIPTSIMLTFASMWVLDYSVNILTLIGLGLGIGMMVDASIVILESIYRKKEQGFSNITAVLEGTKEVATAVIASMLTTIVVFLPIGLIGGEFGSFVMILSMIVVITLLSSVIVSFTLIPSLAENFLKLRKGKEKRKEGKLIHGYSQLISWVVRKKRHSLAIIMLFAIIFASSMFFITKIPMSIMPDIFNRYAELGVELDTGVPIEEKEELFSKIDDTLSDIQDVETNYIMDNGTFSYLIINMTTDDEITRDQKDVNEDILRQIRSLEDDYPINNVFNAMDGGGASSPVQVNIFGEDFVELEAISEELISDLQSIEGLTGMKHSSERTSLEEMIVLNEDAVEDAGLSDQQLQQSIELAFLETPIGEVINDDVNVPLFVRWDDNISSKADLLDVSIMTAEGEEALSTFIDFKTVSTPNEIRHNDGERFLTISADIEGRDLGSINRDVQNAVESFDVSDGYHVSVAGDLEQQQELINEMILVLAAAIFLVYLVMAVQFNNLAHPIVVMSVIPMTFVGVILGLFITQMELSLLAGMGIVMLIGIVLNNAILLIDRINKLRLQGYTVQNSIVEAGKNRIRPIFMTTLTTSGGMLPLALASGASGNYQAPVATVLISGLLFGTLITLLLIPSVYRIFHAIGNGFSRIGKRKKKKTIESKLEQTEEV